MNKLILFSFIIFILACSDNPKPQQISPKKIEEALLEANIRALAVEDEQIDVYLKRKNINAIKTKTGLRYSIYQEGVGEIAKEGKIAKVNYEVTLLNDTLCYSTEGKAEQFLIGKDNVERGLHEGITYMKEGSKAIIIIPSHLAHGLTGDLKKIPLRSTIVYDIELVELK